MKNIFSAKPGDSIAITVALEEGSQRLDNYLASYYENSSRSFFQNLINEGAVSINNKRAKPSTQVRGGDHITILLPVKNSAAPKAATLPPLDVELIHENSDFLIISKPAGLVVHKPHTHSTDVTLVDWLVHHYEDVASVGDADRPGIVHRLDKDTSGLMIIARSPTVHAQLSAQFQARTIQKTYQAIVEGRPEKKGIIDYAIDRHPTDPTKMAYHTGSGRVAQTFYKTIEYYKNHALLELKPTTGRTHQIRVHCLGIGHPLVGDAVYGTSSPLIKRHALHAYKLSFTFGNQTFDFVNEPPEDFQYARELLKEGSQ